MEVGPGTFRSVTSTSEWAFDPEVDGQIHELCARDGVQAGMSRFEEIPSRPIHYIPPGRETLLVIEGRATVQVNGVTTLELEPGVMASLPPAAVTEWRISAVPFVEFWVLGPAAEPPGEDPPG
jgi:quercetin dioxygenase-like cupin family protein